MPRTFDLRTGFRGKVDASWIHGKNRRKTMDNIERLPTFRPWQCLIITRKRCTWRIFPMSMRRVTSRNGLERKISCL